MKKLKASYTVEAVLLLPAIVLLLVVMVTTVNVCSTYNWLHDVCYNATMSINERFYKIQCADLHKLMIGAENGTAVCSEQQKKAFSDFFDNSDMAFSSLESATIHLNKTKARFESELRGATYQQFCTLLSQEFEEYIKNVISRTETQIDIKVDCKVNYQTTKVGPAKIINPENCKVNNESEEYILLIFTVESTMKSEMPLLNFFELNDTYRLTVTTGRV